VTVFARPEDREVVLFAGHLPTGLNRAAKKPRRRATRCWSRADNRRPHSKARGTMGGRPVLMLGADRFLRAGLRRSWPAEMDRLVATYGAVSLRGRDHRRAWKPGVCL